MVGANEVTMRRVIVLIAVLVLAMAGEAFAQQGAPVPLVGPNAAPPSTSEPPHPEVLYVGLNKIEVLRLSLPARTILISNPNVLDIKLDSPSVSLLLGLSVGETDFTILDAAGKTIVAATVVVTPASGNNVTVLRDCTGSQKGCAVEEEFSCGPRCVRVAKPATGEIQTANTGGGGAPLGGGASAAPLAAAAAPATVAQ